MSETAYDEALRGAPEATFFHTRIWGRIVTGAFPQLEDASRTLEVDGRICAVPLYIWRRLGGLLRTTHSSFPYQYGGPVPASPKSWAAVGAFLADQSGSHVISGNPFASPEGQEEPAGFRICAETTHICRLPGSPEAFWSDVLTSRKRNDIRRLSRKGVKVELSRSRADIHTVHALYLKRMESWTQRPGLIYPARLYELLLELGGEHARLYVARFENRIIGGTFVCRYNGISHYLAGYFDHDASRLRPNVLVQERIIRDAITDGFPTYDMLPSAGLASVEAFKESFGGVRTPFARWERTGHLHRLLGRMRGRR